QYLTEKEYDANYPCRRGPARNIVDYMKGDKATMSPIMTNSESIYQFGNNAYGKPATALNILRETIMGRELFDFAFKEYCRRWAFKHPTPDDFFRSMEDASAVDLDWFWRGWFYGTDHCDLSLKEIKAFRLNTHNPQVEKSIDREKKENQPDDISQIRDKEEGFITQVEVDQDMRDFYTTYDPLQVTVLDEQDFADYQKRLTDDEKALLSRNMLYYQISVENMGGLIMPVILELTYADSTTKTIHIPAEIWKKSERVVNKVIACPKEVIQITLDPMLETADVDLSNNYWPTRVVPSRFELFKENKGRPRDNPMQRAQQGQGK
ncbi:MAG: M1 family peptidase, partial [Flavobacteriales bacterium]